MDFSRIINPRTLIVIGLAVASVFVFTACMGKDFGDFVKVKTTTAIQQSEGLPASLTLNEAEYEYRAWSDKVQREGAEWRGRIESGQSSAQLFRSLALQIGEEAASIPAVAAVPGLALLLGFMTKRPGDKSAAETEAEKRASYNKARKDVLTSLEARTATTPASDKAAAELIANIKAEMVKAA